MEALVKHIDSISERIRTAAASCGRNHENISLVAVTKTVPAEHVIRAARAGIRIFGENYIQEAIEKIEKVAENTTASKADISWHFIGHLQSNKSKYAVRHFDLIHSVDSEKLAKEINKQAAKNKKQQRILIQVNIAEEATKSGISADQAIELVRSVSQYENLAIEGLMTMPPFFDSPERARPYFRALAEIRNQIEKENISRAAMKELSMGMTGDFEAAIEEGATLVRIGTAIFGDRQ